MKQIRTYSIPLSVGLLAVAVALRFAGGRLTATAAAAVLLLAAGVLAGSYAFARRLRRRPLVDGAHIYYFRSPF